MRTMCRDHARADVLDGRAGLPHTFKEVADSVFVADLLAPDVCGQVLEEFHDSDPWEQAKVAISRTSDSGVSEIVGIVDTSRRNARRIRFDDLDMARKPVTTACLEMVGTAVSAFTSAEFGMSFDQCGDAEIVHYSEGGEFKPHSDTHRENSRRAFTVIIYLNDDFGEGGTCFPDLEYTCDPRTGRVLIFSSMLMHAGLPVLSGEKKIIVFWVYFPGSIKK